MATPRARFNSGFDVFELGSTLNRNLQAAGYDSPRPIQLEAIPPALEGRDILGLAQTGTGKTAAFALPILERILGNRRSTGPRVLVMAPTRELAIQIEGEFRKLAKSSGIKTTAIYGGVSERTQIQHLRNKPEIVVACPGRLLDLLGKRVLSLRDVETLVLDEADQMFDMGFLPDIRRIMAQIPEERQCLLFAATMPKEIRKLADQILYDPYVVELAHTAPAGTIDHSIYPVMEKQKLGMLKHFLTQDDFVSAIVFTRTKHRAKRLAGRLDKAGHNAIALQGNMSQSQRDRAMKGFRTGVFDVLVATDIVSRGIDVDQVSHVINFDVPNTPEAYTHRIGRTGRSERSGQAFTFVTSDDRAILQAIERKIGQPIRIGKVDGFEAIEEEEALVPTRNSRGRGAPQRPRAMRRKPQGPSGIDRRDRGDSAKEHSESLASRRQRKRPSKSTERYVDYLERKTITTEDSSKNKRSKKRSNQRTSSQRPSDREQYSRNRSSQSDDYSDHQSGGGQRRRQSGGQSERDNYSDSRSGGDNRRRQGGGRSQRDNYSDSRSGGGNRKRQGSQSQRDDYSESRSGGSGRRRQGSGQSQRDNYSESRSGGGNQRRQGSGDNYREHSSEPNSGGNNRRRTSSRGSSSEGYSVGGNKRRNSSGHTQSAGPKQGSSKQRRQKKSRFRRS